MGYNSFRAVRAGGDLDGLRYPVFLRNERSHDGAVSPLLTSAREVDEAIGRALVSGRRLRDLLVVEFCDTADARGYSPSTRLRRRRPILPARFDYSPPFNDIASGPSSPRRRSRKRYSGQPACAHSRYRDLRTLE